MKKIYFLLSILFFTQCQDEKVNTSQNENAIVIITTKVKDGMMPDLVKFMDSENVLPVTRSFDGCKRVSYAGKTAWAPININCANFT